MRTTRWFRAAAAVAVAVTGIGFGLGAGAGAATASTAGGQLRAVAHRPGTHAGRHTVSRASLERSLTCHGVSRGVHRDPVLLVPGTTLDAQSNFSWNYERELDQRHFGWCAVSPPGEMMRDAQVSAEYVAHAIDHAAAASGRKVDILGYSQGGMLPRWVLKYWPGTRKRVDDFVAIDPSNHGTVDADAICLADGCAPSIWQQRDDSHFLTALNHGPETWKGIDYTVVYSTDDEVVVPNESNHGSSALHTGKGRIRNVAVQTLCPADVSDHLAMGTYDPVAAALAFDAFTHRGTAKPSRIPASTCTQVLMPGIDPTTFPTTYAAYLEHVSTTLATTPTVSAEPRLEPYARGSRSAR